MMDKKVFGSIMMALAAGYPKFELGEASLDFYYAILGDLPADLLKAATLEYARQGKWFPTAAELRNEAFDLIDRADGRINASEAWGRVVKAASAVGHLREPKFEEPVIYQAIDAVGGWRHICHAPETTLMSTRARFIEAFERFRTEERTATRMLPQIRELVGQLQAGDKPALPEGVK
jgi:hypothetical protein